MKCTAFVSGWVTVGSWSDLTIRYLCCKWRGASKSSILPQDFLASRAPLYKYGIMTRMIVCVCVSFGLLGLYVFNQCTYLYDTGCEFFLQSGTTELAHVCFCAISTANVAMLLISECHLCQQYCNVVDFGVPSVPTVLQCC